MTSLTETAYYARKGVSYGIVIFMAFLVLKFTWGMVSNFWRQLHPAPAPAPTVAFEKLPKIKFPHSKLQIPASVNFRVETIEGDLPKFTNIGKVYFMPQKPISILSFERMKEQAVRFGFSGEPQKIENKPNFWRFTDTINPLRTLEINEISGNFQILYNFPADLGIFSERNLPFSKEKAVQEAISFLKNYGLFPKDLEEGMQEVSFFKIDVNKLTPTVSLSEADAVEVNFRRKTLDEISILSASKKGLVFVLISPAKDPNKHFLIVYYTYSPIDSDIFATYPLKTTKEAFEELKQERGFLANISNKETDQIIIRKVYLAYFEPEEMQNYLQPIYVFEGSDDFLAFVPAVKDEWIEQ